MFEYYILNPTGNITALVIDRGISVGDYKKISDKLMQKHNNVEQVGFLKIDENNPVLHMAGGEFCGKATMCAAALFCELNHCLNANLLVKVFGIKKLIPVEINTTKIGYDCRAKIPKPGKLSKIAFEINNEHLVLPVVRFRGITHLIINKQLDNATAKCIIEKYYKFRNPAALGIMLLDNATFKMTPIVYVRKCDTLFYENSCASGSCAICSYLAKGSQSEKAYLLYQPGGSLRVSSSDLTDYINLEGNVEIQNHYFEEF